MCGASEEAVLVCRGTSFSLVRAEASEGGGFHVNGQVYEFDHVTPDGYVIAFDHGSEPFLSCNGRLVAATFLVSGGRLDLKRVKCAFAGWSRDGRTLVPRVRPSGKGVLQLEGGVVCKSRRETKHEEDEKDVEESEEEGEECDEEEDVGVEDVDVEVEVEVEVEDAEVEVEDVDVEGEDD
jgi:hypothetical protein